MTSHPLGNVFEAMMDKGQDQIRSTSTLADPNPNHIHNLRVSPNLNPKNHKSYQYHYHYQYQYQLFEAILDNWMNFSLEYIHNLHTSIPRHIIWHVSDPRDTLRNIKDRL